MKHKRSPRTPRHALRILSLPTRRFVGISSIVVGFISAFSFWGDWYYVVLPVCFSLATIVLLDRWRNSKIDSVLSREIANATVEMKEEADRFTAMSTRLSLFVPSGDRSLRLISMVGRDGKVLPGHLYFSRSEPVGKALSGYAWALDAVEEGEAVREKDQRIHRSALSMPVIVHGRILGVVSVDFDRALPNEMRDGLIQSLQESVEGLAQHMESIVILEH